MTDAFEVELALDRVWGELSCELRGHVIAFARAHAAGLPPPGAPEIASRDTTLAIARSALVFDELRGRGAALLRLVAPVAIEHAPEVATERGAERTWAAWRRLASARDAAARARFGIGYRALIHQLAGVELVDSGGERAPQHADPLAPPLDGWHAPDGAPLDAGAVEALWAELCARAGLAAGGLAIVHGDHAHPRCFLPERGAHAIVVLPAVIETPAARFQVLHELGHALLGLGSRREWPRALDEAAASCVARWMEAPGALPAGWSSPLARAARERRLSVARGLDALERGDLEPPRELARPPWALWHDPAAQAVYVAAEALADAACRRMELEPASSSLGHVFEALAEACDDALVTLGTERV